MEGKKVRKPRSRVIFTSSEQRLNKPSPTPAIVNWCTQGDTGLNSLFQHVLTAREAFETYYSIVLEQMTASTKTRSASHILGANPGQPCLIIAVGWEGGRGKEGFNDSKTLTCTPSLHHFVSVPVHTLLF